MLAIGGMFRSAKTFLKDMLCFRRRHHQMCWAAGKIAAERLPDGGRFTR
jgi:hypothetical protein